MMNDTVVAALREWGCDTEGALERIRGNRELYRMLLNEVLKEPSFAILGDALKKGDVAASFEAAHMIKGFLANMGLTPMYQTANEIVEPLRRGEIADVLPKYDRLMWQLQELSVICRYSVNS